MRRWILPWAMPSETTTRKNKKFTRNKEYFYCEEREIWEWKFWESDDMLKMFK